MRQGRPPLNVERLEDREVPAAGITESFDTTPAPALPAGWVQWSTTGTAGYQIAGARTFSGSGSLTSNVASNVTTRAWLNQSQAADSAVQAAVFADSLIPVQVFARGQKLDTATPTYYAVNVVRGVQVDLIKVVNGVQTTIASVKSATYVSGQWVTVNLAFSGDSLSVRVKRADNGQFLDATGKWSAAESVALTAKDATIAAGGFAGVNRRASYAGAATVDDFVVQSATPTPPPPPPATVSENFNAAPPGALPAGWSGWSNGTASFNAASTRAVDGLGLFSTGGSTLTNRAWNNEVLGADAQVAASVYVDSLVPSQIFLRGSNLNTATPTYYALSIIRGLEVTIVRVNNGVATTIAKLKSNTYVSGQWLNVEIAAQGGHLQARVQRADTKQWLNRWGDWSAESAAAIDVNDSSISSPGLVGVNRPSSYSGNVAVDNFAAGPERDDIDAPTLKVTLPNPISLTGQVTLGLTVSDASGIRRVEYIVDDLLVDVDRTPGFDWALDTRNFANGIHRLLVRAYDNNGNVAESSALINFANLLPAPPTIPQHYQHIRVAALAYNGNPMGTFERQLLQSSIDLVVPYLTYLDTINQTSPNTPQLIYTNVSNIYLELLTDWLNYADRMKVSRELAFYHAAAPTAFSGQSGSAVPVNNFWNVQTGPLSGTTGFKKLTSESRDAVVGDVKFAAAGQALYFGYTEKFREINFNLSAAKKAGWAGVIEYASAVDANGNPTAWKTLSLKGDGTNGFGQSGQIVFDPPADWVAAAVTGWQDRLFYLRIRTTAGTADLAPVATSILGRDYVGANGGKAGTIPVFDYAADRDGDGYLNDAEYAARKTGSDARFTYESRLFYPYYGQQRFIVDPGQQAAREWAADYTHRFLAANPLADGVFLDNSSGKNPILGYSTIEDTSTYVADYAALLATVNRKIAPKWTLANTSNGGAETDQVVTRTGATVEEFAIRALTATWSQFNDLAATISRRLALSNTPNPLVIDSMSTGGAPTDARTQMATLAYYYMIGDSKSTMLMLWGGEEPKSEWSRHWFNALTYNVGQAKGAYSLFATGSDPSNTALTYNVYGRQYDNALVLYKPLSYGLGRGTGTTADASATTHQLGGNYRVLNANGTLGPVVTSVTLRNGEGAVLIKA